MGPKLSELWRRTPLRLRAMFLGAFILGPLVLLAAHFFPGRDRETIAVSFAFAMAALIVFCGPSRRR